MKFIKVGQKAFIKLSDGTTFINDEFSEEDVKFMMEVKDEEEVKLRFMPVYKDYNEALTEYKSAQQKGEFSTILEFKDGKYIIPKVSEVSVSQYMVDKILEAEKEKDTNRIEGYINFWTLLCQNPNTEARDNLLWFLDKHGFSILKSGLFTAFRSVVSIENLFSKTDMEEINNFYNKVRRWKKSPKNYEVVERDCKIQILHKNLIKEADFNRLGNLCSIVERDHQYTDKYTKTMKISLGTPVRIPRSECDEDSSNECSSGLHLTHSGWSSLNSFGNKILLCLCNPANVTAVPTKDSYNKIRTCEYFPVKEVTYIGGSIVDSVKDGEEMDYFEISYGGEVVNENTDTFRIDIPELPNINKEKITLNIEEIKQKLKQRQREK